MTPGNNAAVVADESPFSFHDMRHLELEVSRLQADYLRQLFATPQFVTFMPDRYVVVDCETTGFSRVRDCITQVGYCVFSGDGEGLPSSSGGVLLKMPPGATMTKGAMEITGITPELCAAQGANREEALRSFFNLIALAVSNGYALLGHNVVAFDTEFFEHAAESVGMRDWKMHCDNVIDTGMLVKAMKMRTRNLSYLPHQGESRCEFYKRVSNAHSLAKWNLGLSRRHFRLDQLFNMGGLKEHDASADCLITHYLWMAMRRIIQEGAAL